MCCRYHYRILSIILERLIKSSSRFTAPLTIWDRDDLVLTINADTETSAGETLLMCECVYEWRGDWRVCTCLDDICHICQHSTNTS